MTGPAVTYTPVTSLTLRQLALPLGALAFACLLAIALTWTQLSDNVSYLQMVIGVSVTAAGFGWLKFSWRPGAGSQSDIIVPWLTVLALLVGGYAIDDGSFTFTGALLGTIALYALPFMAALTLLTRLHAPTDLCSSSSSIGFCAAGFALAFMALATPVPTLTITLYTCAVTLGIVMGVSRFTLCHLIKW